MMIRFQYKKRVFEWFIGITKIEQGSIDLHDQRIPDEKQVGEFT